MFRRCVYFGAALVAIVLLLGSPSYADAQRSRGGSPMMRPHTGMNNRFMMNNTNRFMMNNNRFMSPFGFESRFRTGAFDPRFGRDRFDRFEDRFENRFNRRLFVPRFSPGFGPGFFHPF